MNKIFQIDPKVDPDEYLDITIGQWRPWNKDIPQCIIGSLRALNSKVTPRYRLPLDTKWTYRTNYQTCWSKK